MRENKLQAAVQAIESRGAPRPEGLELLKKPAAPGSPGYTAPAAPSASSPLATRWADALREAGRPGAERLLANEGLDVNAPLAPGRHPRTEYGSLVHRLITRRAAKAGLSVGAVLAAAGKTASVASPKDQGGSSVVNMSIAGTAMQVPTSYDPLLVLLVNRVTGGFSQAEYDLAEMKGFDDYIAHHIDYTNIDDDAADMFLMGDPTTYLSQVENDSAEQLLISDPNQPAWIVSLQASNLYRGVLSKRSFHERMTEFWTDHFNIDLKLPFQAWVKPVDHREVIRDNAFGSFPTMLTASVHSAAMLLYLDQWSSDWQAPNENYARELLELHTVGEGNGYDEVDVENVAQILCGWSINTNGLFGPLLTYRYLSGQHDPMPQAYTILNNHPQKIAIPAGGEIQGDKLIEGLAAHPLTADYIATKMLRFLLQYEPTPAQIADISNVYQMESGDITKMIKAILTPANLNALLATSPTTLKVKRPKQLACTFSQAIGADLIWPPVGPGFYNPLQALSERLESLGNAPFFWGPPNGYPDAEGAWIGNLLGRWDMLDSITRNELPGLHVDYVKLLNILAPLPDISLTGFRLNEKLAGGAMTPSEQFWVQEYVDIGVILFNLGFVTAEELTREVFAVAASAPSYQYY